MTNEPEKPETPGLAEVSAKFVDELRSRDPVLDQIDRIEEAARLTDAMPVDEQRDLARDRVIEHEVQVFQTRAETLPGLLAKARMAYRISTGRAASGEPLQTTDARRKSPLLVIPAVALAGSMIRC